ncbi:putative secreted protein [Pseudomonas sp. SHC52]|nr:putative secreted protein [Pseudomonas sp. SHC52]
MRLMMEGIQTLGMQAAEGTVERLQALIGHPLRTYEAFVREAVAGV